MNNIYRVRVYSIGYGENLGNDTLLGNVIVKKNLFGADEISTGVLIRKVPFNTIGKKHPNSYLRPYAYKEFGYDLAIIKEDINDSNKVSSEDIKKYLDVFNGSSIEISFFSCVLFLKYINISFSIQREAYVASFIFR